MVLLGVAVTLTVVVLDLLLAERLGIFFDLCFVLLCIGLALLVRPSDFFTVGVLPPLIMLIVFVLVALWHSTALAARDSGVAHAVMTGLAHHAAALGTGYAACLLCLAVRDRFARVR